MSTTLSYSQFYEKYPNGDYLGYCEHLGIEADFGYIYDELSFMDYENLDDLQVNEAIVIDNSDLPF